MELSGYARAIAGRWVRVVATAAAGMLLAGTVGLLAPTAYQARVALYVDAAVVTDPQDPSSAAQVRRSVVPSVAELATSSTVLGQVADTLGLTDSPAALAAGVDVTTDNGTTVLLVSATRPTPAEATAVARELAAEVTRQADLLYAGADGPLLRVTTVRDAAGALPTSRGVSLLAALGLAAGGGAAGLAAGLAELARPRVRGRDDVARSTPAPVLALLPALPSGRRPLFLRGGAPDRAEEVVRARWALRCAAGTEDAQRIALLGPGATRPLADELTAPGLGVVAVGSAQELTGSGPFDRVVVVADGRRTTDAGLTAALETARVSGTPLAGVLVDGLLPPGAGWRALLRAGARGEATWWLDGRSRAPRSGSVPAAGLPRVVAALAVAMVGFTRPLPMGLTTGVVAAVALLPLWWPVVRRTRGLPALLVLAGVGLVSGALLAWYHSTDHAFVLNEASVRASTVLALVGGVGVLVWARDLLPLPVLGTAYGLGMLVTGLTGVTTSADAWKFQLSAPLMVLALSLAAHGHRPRLTVVVLALLGVANIVNDARSAFGFCVVAAALLLWQQRPEGAPRTARARRWLVLPALAALGAAGYRVLTELMLAGALGGEIQQRTATQIAQTGSLLLGGRPEWTVTWALMREHPFGFGLGTVPSSTDVLVGKAGIAVTNIPTAEGYLVNQLLAGGVHLHSIVADLWADLGPAGLLLGLVAGALVVAGLADSLTRRRASGLVCLLAPMALWGLAFGPLSSNADTLVLALGLLLLPRRGAPAADAPRAAVPRSSLVPA